MSEASVFERGYGAGAVCAIRRRRATDEAGAGDAEVKRVDGFAAVYRSASAFS
ncbi:hypothetical protein KCP75_20720 [Salmonella enterica subsp. enterica]|nr:hypothetical protein KCP75_20720 [Salmonella enterica subsp. enterica]